MSTRIPAVLLATVAVLASAMPAKSDPRIVGGKDADEPYAFMASVQRVDGVHFCGGAIIASGWVVTAAHCVSSWSPAGVRVRVNSHTTTEGGKKHEVKRIVTPGSRQAPEDIALLELASPTTSPPVLVSKKRVGVGARSRILGWGQTCVSGGCAPKVLQQLDTYVLPAGMCKGIDAATEICTDSPGRTSGACHGDSGGPQIVRRDDGWELVGVTSGTGAGLERACSTDPSIYTDVVSYRGWIIGVGVPLNWPANVSPPRWAPTAPGRGTGLVASP